MKEKLLVLVSLILALGGATAITLGNFSIKIIAIPLLLLALGFDLTVFQLWKNQSGFNQ
jgi:hypothetical protein